MTDAPKITDEERVVVREIYVKHPDGVWIDTRTGREAFMLFWPRWKKDGVIKTDGVT